MTRARLAPERPQARRRCPRARGRGRQRGIADTGRDLRHSSALGGGRMRHGTCDCMAVSPWHHCRRRLRALAGGRCCSRRCRTCVASVGTKAPARLSSRKIHGRRGAGEGEADTSQGRSVDGRTDRGPKVPSVRFLRFFLLGRGVRINKSVGGLFTHTATIVFCRLAFHTARACGPTNENKVRKETAKTDGRPTGRTAVFGLSPSEP